MKEKITNNKIKSLILKIAILLLFVCLLILVRFSGVGKYLTLESLKQNKVLLEIFVRENYFISILIFVFVYIISVALSVPGATILTLTGGFLFGYFLGTLYVNIGATIGASLNFIFAKYLIGDWIQSKYQIQLDMFNKEIENNGKFYFLTLRFIPLFPFFLINLFLGLTKISLMTFVWTTSIGILPGAFVFAFAGSQLSSVNSLKDILSSRILLSFIFLAIFAVIPVFFKKYFFKRKDKKSEYEV